jgi:hypothetical protein
MALPRYTRSNLFRSPSTFAASVFCCVRSPACGVLGGAVALDAARQAADNEVLPGPWHPPI